MITFPSARYARGLPTVSSCLHGEQTSDAELAALAPATLPTVSKQPQLKLKPQLQHKLLRSLRSLRPPCLRSPCSEGANRSPRYARRTICTFFAFSGVWQLFAFCLLVRSSLKGRKRKAAKIICRLRSPHTCMASRGAEGSKLGPPLYIAMQTSPCSFDNRFYIIVCADNNDYRFIPTVPSDFLPPAHLVELVGACLILRQGPPTSTS